MKRVWMCAILMSAVSVAAGADKKTVKLIQLPDDNAMATLKPGPGVEATRANCQPCHSTDYIVRQPGSDAKHWEAEVKKMATVYGAPISDEDVKAIVEYLSSAYGPPAASETIPPKEPPGKPGKSKGSKHL